MIKDMIKNRDIDSIQNTLNTKGNIYVLSLFAEVLDKRSYFNISPQGKIKTKEINYILPIFAFEDNPKILSEKILELSDLREKTKIKKINRHSNQSMDKLKVNFMKTMTAETVEFAMEFGKEIFLRNEEEFYQMISIFSLTGGINSLKSLLVLSFTEIVKKYKKENITDEILYLLISFLSKYRDNYYDTDNYYDSLDETLSIEILYRKILDDKSLVMTRRCLELLSYITLIKKITLEKKSLYINIVADELNKKNTSRNLNENEKFLVEKLIKFGE